MDSGAITGADPRPLSLVDRKPEVTRVEAAEEEPLMVHLEEFGVPRVLIRARVSNPERIVTGCEVEPESVARAHPIGDGVELEGNEILQVRPLQQRPAMRDGSGRSVRRDIKELGEEMHGRTARRGTNVEHCIASDVEAVGVGSEVKVTTSDRLPKSRSSG